MATATRRQARNEALVRFGPQRFALRELLAELVGQRETGLRAAVGTERGLLGQIGHARQETTRTYDDAIKAGEGTTDLVQQTLAALGASADPFEAALSREGGLGTERMNQSRAGALQDLTERSLEAASGRAYQQHNVENMFRAETGKVRRSYEELAREEGAFTQGRMAELRKEAADRTFRRDLEEFKQGEANQRARMQQRTTRRGQDIRRRRANERETGSGKTVGGGKKIRTQDAHESLSNAVNGALIDARKQKQRGRQRGEVQDLLTNGREQQSIEDPETGEKLKVPGIKSRGALAARVAADMAWFGKVSRSTLAELHRNGYSIKQLGLPYVSAGDRRTVRRPPNAPGPRGQVRPT
jgi:hypothetical protein